MVFSKKNGTAVPFWTVRTFFSYLFLQRKSFINPETIWILVLEFMMMYFFSDRGIFETHSRATGRKNNDKMAKKTHNKAEG